MDSGKKITYLTIPGVGGRLGNQLYYVLQAYLNSRCDCTCKYLINSAGRECGFMDTARLLNMEEFVAEQPLGTPVELVSDYYQRYGFNFSKSQLNGFIENTILKSPFFAKMRDRYSEVCTDDVVCINIRNGDYLRMPAKRDFASFDRVDYIHRSLEKIGALNFARLDVLSDDNRLNEKIYGRLFRSAFRNVRYLDSTNPPEDMLRLAFYKTRIITNSTFSYWGCYIGDCIGQDSVTVAPNYFTHHSLAADHCAPYWRIVDVRMNISAAARAFGFRVVNAVKLFTRDVLSGR